jgi:hypothetical protein
MAVDAATTLGLGRLERQRCLKDCHSGCCLITRRWRDDTGTLAVDLEIHVGQNGARVLTGPGPLPGQDDRLRL